MSRQLTKDGKWFDCLSREASNTEISSGSLCCSVRCRVLKSIPSRFWFTKVEMHLVVITILIIMYSMYNVSSNYGMEGCALKFSIRFSITRKNIPCRFNILCLHLIILVSLILVLIFVSSNLFPSDNLEQRFSSKFWYCIKISVSTLEVQ